MLVKTVQMTDGAVLEFGSGVFSTPLLHWLLAESRRKLVTCENNEDYHNFALKFRSRTHHIRLVKEWDEVSVNDYWSVILIDHNSKNPKRRSVDALRFKNNADYIVLHDSNVGIYGYDDIWREFKYRHDWKFGKPWTTVLSNTKDLSNL